MTWDNETRIEGPIIVNPVQVSYKFVKISDGKSGLQNSMYLGNQDQIDLTLEISTRQNAAPELRICSARLKI